MVSIGARRDCPFCGGKDCVYLRPGAIYHKEGYLNKIVTRAEPFGFIKVPPTYNCVKEGCNKSWRA